VIRWRFVSLFLAFVLLTPTFLAPSVPAYAQDWGDFSADVDGDGLPNVIEQEGWYNDAGGPYYTNARDADTDGDGLTDGEEKLYGTDPSSGQSPGLYVKYEDHLQTREYFCWQRFGNNYIALPYPSNRDAVVVRRGTTFHVGGPADASIEIEKSISGLTTLTPEWDQCAGGWKVYVPSGGTVGIYTITVEDGAWSESLNLYVIFDLPSGQSDDFISAYVYTESPQNRASDGDSRTDVSLAYAEGNDDATPPPREYTNNHYAWIPQGEWVNHGYVWGFNNQHYERWIVKDHVMPYINGLTSRQTAANALGDHIDRVTCLDWPRTLYNSWQVLHPLSYPPYNAMNQCSNVAAALTAFHRAAGIPSRPVFTDWRHGTFDHSTEVWVGSWRVMRGATNEHGLCATNPNVSRGYRPLSDPRGWYYGQGVYAAGEDWPWNGLGGFSTYGDKFRQNSWDSGVIVKYAWWETRFRAYWGTSSEPRVIGTPPQDWPNNIPAPPSVDFDGDPVVGVPPLTVQFDGQYSGHIRTQEWEFGDTGTSGAGDPDHTYYDVGRFTVSLTAQGAGGTTTEEKPNYIRVYEPVNAEFTASPTSGDAPLTVGFTNNSTGDVGSCLWEFGDLSTSTNCNPDPHTYMTEVDRDYTVQLTVQGLGGDSDHRIRTDYIHVNAAVLAASLVGSADGPVEDEEAPAVASEAGAPESLVYLPVVFKEGIPAPNEDEPEPDDPGPGVNDPDAVIQFGQLVDDYGVDLDGDGRFDELVLEVEVDARQAGDYWILGALAGELAYALEEVHLEEGGNTVALRFDGDSIYMSKTDGPYVLAGLWATEGENPGPAEFADNELGYARPGHRTSAYAFGDFGVAGATLSEDYSYRVVDTDVDGRADALVVETGLNIERAGNYTVRGALQDGQDDPLGEALWTGSGSNVTLQFDGLRDTVGPYSLYLHVRDADGQVTDGIVEPYDLGELSELSAKAITLGVETVTPPNVSLLAPTFVITDGYSDSPVDADGDGQFDQLVFTVNVEVEPGEGGQAYRVEGWLIDENDSLISYAIGDSEVLNEGIQSLTLVFDGRIIHEHGVDGRYTLAALRALAGDTYSVLGEVDVAYATPPYDHDDFEDPIAVPMVGDVFEDRMETKMDYVATESFEAGALGAAWTTSSSTGNGRIQMTDSYGAAGGTYALMMDDVSDGGYTLNQATWTVDLSGVAEASLVFWHAEWNDEEHGFSGPFTGSYNADGIAISDDGTNWHPVFDAPNQEAGVWRQHIIDLTAEAAAAGMTLGPGFRIRFQQYDDYPLDSDGRGWDEIVVVESAPSNPWTSESPWSLTDRVWYSYSHAWEANATGSESGSLTVPIDVSNYADPLLRLRTCYAMQSPGDVGYLEVSTDDGVGWTKVATYTNSISHWSTEFVDLNRFDAVPNLHLRFTANSQDRLRWFVDDLRLIGWLDSDTDGLNDLDENSAGTDPHNPDTDGDGILDGREADYGTNPRNPDSDGDGIPDGWEVDNGLDPLHGNDAGNDPDGDGLTNLEEYQHGTDPHDGDSDDDGLVDGDEVDVHGTNPKDPDSDDDGLSDGDEVNVHGTNPKDPDSDDDGLSDGDEVNVHGTNPKDPDSDDDGLSDGDEVNVHDTNPKDPDSDDDGMPDGWEVDNGLDPLDGSDADDDPDGDSLTNVEEYQHGTDPHDDDSDDDGLSDSDELAGGTDPTDPDSDDDGLLDGDELDEGTDPNDPDSDDDGMSDGWEVDNGFDPLDGSDIGGDPDNDGLTNLDEFEHGTDPHKADTDGDGINDGKEVEIGTDPTNPDTDGDGIPDGKDKEPLKPNYYRYLPIIVSGSRQL